MVMIRAYVDECSTHEDPNSPLLVYASVSPYRLWLELDKPWAKALKRDDVPYAHAKELVHREGPFAGWDLDRQLKFANRLDKLTRRYVSFCCCTVLKRSDFLEYRSKGKGLNTLLDSDYGVSMRVCFSFLQFAVPVLIQAKSYDVYTVIENGHKNAGSAVDLQRKMAKYVTGCLIRPPGYASKPECFGLQVSDMNAYATLLLEERGDPQYAELDAENPSEWLEFARGKKPPVFRLPITGDILSDLRDNVILSKPKFQKRFGHLLSSLE